MTRSSHLPNQSRGAPKDFSFWTDFVRSMDPEPSLNSTLQNIARNGVRISGGDGCLIHLFNRKRNLLEAALRYKVGKGFAHPVKPGVGIPGSTLRQRQVVVEPDFRKDSSGLWKEEARKEGILSAICLPLRDKRTIIGTLTLLSRKIQRYGGKEIPLLSALADQAAVAIENASSFEKIRGQMKAISVERKRERQIRNFLENIVDRSIDPIMATDLHGRFTFASRGAEEMFGIPKKDILGKRITDFYAGGEREAERIMKTLARKEKLRSYETEFIGPKGQEDFRYPLGLSSQRQPGESRGHPGSKQGNHGIQKPSQPYQPDRAKLPEVIRSGQRRHLLSKPQRILQHLQPNVFEDDGLYGKGDPKLPFFQDYPS